MKVNLLRLVATIEVETDLPEVCPHCGADLRAEEALSALYLMKRGYTGQVGPGGTFQSSGWTDSYYDVALGVNAYECTGCNQIVATAEPADSADAPAQG